MKEQFTQQKGGGRGSSSKATKAILLSSIALNVVLCAILAFFIFTQAMPSSSPNADLTSGEETEALSGPARAIELLPKPEQAVRIRPVNDEVYWIWVTTDGRESGNGEQSWLVDVADGTAETVKEHHLGPGAPDVRTRKHKNNEHMTIYWKGSYEGTWNENRDYIHTETGEQVLTLRLASGQKAFVETEEEELEVTLAPQGLCDGVSFEKPKETASATGVLINDELYPFPNEIDVECRYVDIDGTRRHEGFRYLNLNESHTEEEQDTIRIGLPGEPGNQMHIPFPSLDLEQISYPNWR